MKVKEKHDVLYEQYATAQSKLVEVGVTTFAPTVSSFMCVLSTYFLTSCVCVAQVEAYGSKIAEEMEKLNALETEENRE